MAERHFFTLPLHEQADLDHDQRIGQSNYRNATQDIEAQGFCQVLASAAVKKNEERD